MARPGRRERNRAARSFHQLRRFHHVINSDKVFGTHSDISPAAALIFAKLGKPPVAPCLGALELPQNDARRLTDRTIDLLHDVGTQLALADPLFVVVLPNLVTVKSWIGAADGAFAAALTNYLLAELSPSIIAQPLSAGAQVNAPKRAGY